MGNCSESQKLGMESSGLQGATAASMQINSLATEPSWQNLNPTKRIDYESGAVYHGDTLNDKPNGNGVLEFENACFRGSFVNGMPNGAASVVLEGAKFYEGPLINGIPHGIGTFFLPGLNYNGDISNGVCEGMGYCRWEDGTEYEGAFLSGQPHGKGLLRYPDGLIFVGKFASGKKHGRGNFLWDKTKSLDVEFENGKLVDEDTAIIFNGVRVPVSLSNGQIAVK